ncbi:MAG TPA: NADH-quinone oxidoreductase subunit L [Micromonosporaceae bacterium]|nr:NADH-quinone oxidoreductase subunit L [Micromonosporaceae bacterium]
MTAQTPAALVEAVSYAPAHGVLSSMWLLIAIPAASALILLVAGKRADKWGHILGVASVGAAFILGLIYFFSLRGLSGSRTAELNLWSYIPVGRLQIEFGFLFDPLAAIFVLLITGVGFLIHLYAVGYMAGDPGRRRFFGYFNLFVAAMLTLVLANNYLILYLGWEGVGLASYLLIAFYTVRPAAATAGKKAFIMNRVGDAGMSLALFLMFAAFGTVNFTGVFNGVPNASQGIVVALALLLLLGACAKSGQFPLQAWLPDAMEGPTPVSALIHAATMVTAGVYLIARSEPIFNHSPDAQSVVVAIGAFTLVIGSIIGCAKDDIKRVLAWSTVSQIGYMFLGVGLGGAAYALALIHLLAHGFFKANLFLSAGSVMHGMHDQTDIRRFGGLWKYMRITWLTFAMGWLAIIGIPPLSGFFTKDPIIFAAFNRPGWTGWVLGLAAMFGAGLTAFYMTRLFVLTFHGPERYTEDNKHPHESPPIMTIPLILLAVGSIIAGVLMKSPVVNWLTPVLQEPHEVATPHIHELTVTLLTLLLVVLGAGGAWALFRRGTALEPQPAGAVVTAARNNLYGDALNEALFEKPGIFLTRALVFFDNKGIDGAVNGLAALVGGGSGRLRRTQTGYVRTYALSMLGGALIVLVAVLAVTVG